MTSDHSAGSGEETNFGAFFVHKTVIIPHDEKKYRGGEDAAATSSHLLVVADGVGGWANSNVNPGLYSRLLTKSVVDLGTKNTSMPLMELVHAANWIAADQHLGSATCTTLKLTGKDTIQTLNVGDSGYSIHRKDEEGKWSVVFASEPGQKRFNYPDQLGGKYGDVVEKVGTILVPVAILWGRLTIHHFDSNEVRDLLVKLNEYGLCRLDNEYDGMKYYVLQQHQDHVLVLR